MSQERHLGGGLWEMHFNETHMLTLSTWKAARKMSTCHITPVPVPRL